ncbi:MAG: hypothetical protein ACRDZM_19155 [Acidimicrobiia bacterium]
MEIAIIGLGVLALIFAGLTLNRARPKVTVERVPGHPDTFELWNEGPGTAVIIHADVVSPGFPQGVSIDDASAAIPGLAVDDRIRRDMSQWAKGSTLDPFRRFEVRLPSATTLRIAYRADGLLGSLATSTVVVEGGH